MLLLDTYSQETVLSMSKTTQGKGKCKSFERKNNPEFVAKNA